MAASNQTALVGPFATVRVALEATAANARQIICPSWASQVTATFLTSAAAADTGKIASSGTDGSALGDDHLPVASGGALSWQIKSSDQVGGATPSIYVVAGTNSAFCHLLFEEARA